MSYLELKIKKVASDRRFNDSEGCTQVLCMSDGNKESCNLEVEVVVKNFKLLVELRSNQYLLLCGI